MSRPDPFALQAVQKWFQAVITHPGGVAGGAASPEAQQVHGGGLENIITRSSTLDAAGRLAVYANAYHARLLECLRESFPVLVSAMGEEAFDGFAFDYLQQHPSQSYTLEHLSDHFADFLKSRQPGPQADPDMAEWAAFLVDLARLEWTIEKVFDGPGIESSRVLGPEDLAGVQPAQWAGARLVPVVCLRLLRFDFPVNTYFTQAKKAADAASLGYPDRAAEHVAITRRDYVVRRHALSAEQFCLLKALQSGATVSQAIAGSTSDSGLSDAQWAQNLQGWFADWAAEQFFERVEL